MFLFSKVVGFSLTNSIDASMKVSVELLQRVYNALQEDGQRSDGEAEVVDPESHLFVIDAFEMPRWHWSIERGTFEK